eukprot:gene3228-7439_t
MRFTFAPGGSQRGGGAATAATIKMGDHVKEKYDERLTSDDGKWSLEVGEAAEVMDVDCNGHFALRNPGGLESRWYCPDQFISAGGTAQAA